MKKYKSSRLFIIFSIAALFLISCGIPNYSPINIFDTSFSSDGSVITISGDVISLYGNSIRSDEPKLCFFYTIAPSSASYISAFQTAFDNLFYSNTNFNVISYAPNGQSSSFLTARVNNGTEAGLYQFRIDESKSYSEVQKHKESFIAGKTDFTSVLSDALVSEFSFELKSDTKEIVFSFRDSAGDEHAVFLKRFNDTVFTSDSISGGSSYADNELPASLDTSTGSYSVYIFAASEVAFDSSSFSNVLHSHLRMIKEIVL